jgi:putative ABC transport system permease protein
MVTELQGLPEQGAFTEIRTSDEPNLGSSSSSLGATVMVSADHLPPGLIGVSERDAARAEAMLRRGGVVAFVSSGGPADGSDVKVIHSTYDKRTGEDTGRTRTTAPAAFVTVPGAWMGPSAVVSPQVAQQLQVEPQTVSLAVTGVEVTDQQEEAIDEGLTAIAGDVGLYVERGYQPDDATVIAQLVLIVLGAVLMLGGTLTATFLALSDARPDLATLSAVGASPSARRGVAAAYAVVVGVVGAVLGGAVGFIPGVAVTWPLTSSQTSEGAPIGPFLDVPWLMVLALVAVLPAATALVVGLFARSRLPLVARLD